MDGWLNRGNGASVAQSAKPGANLCPACGSVATAATSRYCGRHLAELRAQWSAFRAMRREYRAA